jgi:SAM-dependent methyltransferase
VLIEARRVLRPGGVLLHAADEQSALWRVWRERIDRELGYEHVGVPRARFEDFPEDHGWRLAGPVRRLAFETRLAPRDLVDRMAKRTWSVTWRLSDAELDRTVALLRDELLARFGELDREVTLEAGFWVRAYRWGGA